MKYRVNYKIPDWKGEEVFKAAWWKTYGQAKFDEMDIQREGIVTWIEERPDDYEDPPPPPPERIVTEPPPGYGD